MNNRVFYNISDPAEKQKLISDLQSSDILLSQKVSILNTLLDTFNGYYFECAQTYTQDSSDKVAYEKSYAAALLYFNFFNDLHAAQFVIPQDVEEKYENYLFYGEDCLFRTCKPPHPSTTVFTSLAV